MNCFQEKGILFLVILFCGAIHNSFAMQITLPDGDYKGLTVEFKVNNGKISLIETNEGSSRCEFTQKDYSLYTTETRLLNCNDATYLGYFQNQVDMHLVVNEMNNASQQKFKAKKKSDLSPYLWIFAVGIIAYAQAGFVSDEYKKWVNCFGIAIGLAYWKICSYFFYQARFAKKTYKCADKKFASFFTKENGEIKVNKIEYLMSQM